MNGDGHADIVWRNNALGNNAVWFMKDRNTQYKEGSGVAVSGVVKTYKLSGVLSVGRKNVTQSISCNETALDHAEKTDHGSGIVRSTHSEATEVGSETLQLLAHEGSIRCTGESIGISALQQYSCTLSRVPFDPR